MQFVWTDFTLQLSIDWQKKVGRCYKCQYIFRDFLPFFSPALSQDIGVAKLLWRDRKSIADFGVICVWS